MLPFVRLTCLLSFRVLCPFEAVERVAAWSLPPAVRRSSSAAIASSSPAQPEPLRLSCHFQDLAGEPHVIFPPSSPLVSRSISGHSADSPPPAMAADASCAPSKPMSMWRVDQLRVASLVLLVRQVGERSAFYPVSPLRRHASRRRRVSGHLSWPGKSSLSSLVVECSFAGGNREFCYGLGLSPCVPPRALAAASLRRRCGRSSSRR